MEENIPVFIERDPSVIMAESKRQLEEFLGRELQPAQVEQLILNFIVYREVLINNRFNAGMRQMLVKYSSAPVLDYLAALVALERLPSSNAGCTVRFTLVYGHGTVLIPAGTRVSTSDGAAVFETEEDMPVLPEINAVEVQAAAQTAGKAANGYTVGTVNKILDPLAFVSTVENTEVTGGGSDEETDDQLRERIKLAPSQYSSAGSVESYKFYAKSANALITDVAVTSPVPGTVLIVPLTEGGEAPQQVIEDVYAVCSGEKVRPLTDTVIVAAAVARTYMVEVNIELYENTDAVQAKDEITALLKKWADGKEQKLGQDIIRSHISALCRLPSVYDVDVVRPADNMPVNDEQYAQCTGITVNITGFNRG